MKTSFPLDATSSMMTAAQMLVHEHRVLLDFAGVGMLVPKKTSLVRPRQEETRQVKTGQSKPAEQS